jgi:hypothetical protein
VRGVQIFGRELGQPLNGKRAVCFVMRFIMVPLMLAFGTYTVVTGGLDGLVSLLPILVAHVVGFMVIYPLWVLYRRRRVAAAQVSDVKCRR